MQSSNRRLGVHRHGDRHARAGSKSDQARADRSETDCSDAVGLADAKKERHPGS